MANDQKKLGPWRCFHCEAVFWKEDAARLHFGPDQESTPACQIKASEGGLLRALREAEADAQQARWDLHAESADGLKAYRGNLSRHHAALTSAEETGYERGVRDMAPSVERLRRLLHKYGDRIPLATNARPDWQQEIDEAFEWVANNPEAARDG